MANIYQRAPDRPRQHFVPPPLNSSSNNRGSPTSLPTADQAEGSNPLAATMTAMLNSDHPLAASGRNRVLVAGRATRVPGRVGAAGTQRHRTRLKPLEDIVSEAASSSRDPSSRPPNRRPDGSEHSSYTTRRETKSTKKTDPLAAFGYRTLGPIAAGAFSTVVRAKRLGGGDEVAVKSFNRAKYNKQGWLKTALKNELEVLVELQGEMHSNIANLIDIFEAPAATHAILEYCSGGSVHRHLKNLRHGHSFSEAVRAPPPRRLPQAPIPASLLLPRADPTFQRSDD